ncbi:MAG: hypothetical protein Q7J85_11535 [Bacillota bacterium]|nr:hypothetical protein [Bacillota bacterium]
MLKSELNTRNKEENKEYTSEHRNNSKLKFKVRFDYKGKPRPARFFFGGKKTEIVAQDFRDQQVALWRNVPLQGLLVENMDLGEIYSVYDEEIDEELAFAPLELVVSADSLEDLLRFIVRDEFRRIEILEPASILLTNREVERLLFKINEHMQNRLLYRIREINR